MLRLAPIKNPSFPSCKECDQRAGLLSVPRLVAELAMMRAGCKAVDMYFIPVFPLLFLCFKEVATFQRGFSLKSSVPYCCPSSPQPGGGDSWIPRREMLARVKAETGALLRAVAGHKFSL